MSHSLKGAAADSAAALAGLSSGLRNAHELHVSSAAASAAAVSSAASAAGTAAAAAAAVAPEQHGDDLESAIRDFWTSQQREVMALDHTSDASFKTHMLPFARIKKIMKSDPEVTMISSEAPVVFAKACEMLILELTMRSWAQTKDNDRKTLQKGDVAAAVKKNDVFDFLIDIVPRDNAQGGPKPKATQQRNQGFTPEQMQQLQIFFLMQNQYAQQMQQQQQLAAGAATGGRDADGNAASSDAVSSANGSTPIGFPGSSKTI